MNKEKTVLDTIKKSMNEGDKISISLIQKNYGVSLTLGSAIFKELEKENYIENGNTFTRKNHQTKKLSMDIYLLSNDEKMAEAFKKEFANTDNVTVVCDDFVNFMAEHDEVECIVSPANAFGFMSGGYDKAITECFGFELEECVQKYINDNLYGEQPVGTSIIVRIPETKRYLIHTPTMRLPSPIKDPLVIYQSMRVTLMKAIENNIKSIVIPAFGALTGKISPTSVAFYMKKGYQQIVDFIERQEIDNLKPSEK